MTRVKLDTPAFADQSVDTRTIKDGTIIAQDVSGSLTNAKLANSSISVNGSSVSLGGSLTTNVFLDWQAVTVADGSTTLTAEAGKGYFLDTNTGVIEVFLPTSPSRGDTIGLVDYSGTFATNKLIINTGGRLIDSTTGSEFKVETNNSIVELVYVDANKGWQVILNQAAGTTPSSVLTNGVYDRQPLFTSATGGTVTTSGDYKIHTFTGDGNFIVSSAGNQPDFSNPSPEYSSSGPNTVSYLVVAGGGGAKGNSYRATGDGQTRSAAGGGAGGFREGRDISPSYTASPLVNSSGLTISAQTYPITVGGGGTGGGPVTCGVGGGSSDQTKGSDSIFSTITSAGGGKGGSKTTCGNPFVLPSTPFAVQGFYGGSGGGAGTSSPTDGPGQGASGNTPPVSPPQGNPGGNGSHFPYREGGGGGAGAAGGGPPAGQNTAPGGNGVTTHITGSPVAYAGGGGAANAAGGTSNHLGTGGTGGGGAAKSDANGESGSANTGGGGGGAKKQPCGAGTGVGGSGGKGIVVIRYKFQ